MGVVLQMVAQNDEKHEAAHHRLRGDWRGHDQRIHDVELAISDLRTKVTALDRPADIAVSTLPLRFVAPIVLAGLVAAGAMWRVAGRVDDLSTKMDDTAKLTAAQVKLEEERARTFRESLDDLKKEVKLYEIKADNLEKVLITKGIR